jgi:hypothetical protein
MTTARDLIQGALEKIQVYATGEQASNPDIARGFSELNSMLDSWSNENLTCYAILEQTGTILPGISSYTIGPGGTFNMTRPLKILDGPGRCYIVDQYGNKYPISVVTQDQWNLITQPFTTSDLPSTLFYDPQYPLGIINIYPTPYQSFPLYWDSYLALAEFASLSGVLTLPPGYEKAIRDNLAVELAPYYPSAQLTPALIRGAAKAKANVKRTNIRSLLAYYDPEIVSKARGAWDIYTNSYNR